MAQFLIDVPDELAPGVIATAVLQGKQPEEVVQEYAIALATQTCQDLKVGPFYVGPVPPQFNPDGTPYDPNWVDPNVPVVDNDTTGESEV